MSKIKYANDRSYNIYLVRTLMTSLKTPQEKLKVLRWIRKLTSTSKDTENQLLANDFLYALITDLEEGTLNPPFSQYPPNGSLQALSQLLINKGERVFSGHINPCRGDWNNVAYKAYKQPILYKISPDGGAFLSSQPVPTRGAFCYIGVVWSPKPKTDPHL